MNTTKKITKKTYFATATELVKFAQDQGVELPEGVTYDGMLDFINHEVELLDKKATAAAERAATKKAEGDSLRERVLNAMTDEFQTIVDITSAIGDTDVSPAMVTARLTQLVKLNQVIRDQQSVGGEGKSRKVSVYKLA